MPRHQRPNRDWRAALACDRSLDEKEKDPASIGLIDGDLIQPFRFDSLDFSYTIAL